MDTSVQTVQANHFFSQLVYLGVSPAMAQNAAGQVTVGAMADYYQNNPVGAAYLEARFGAIPEEYALWKAFLAERCPAFGDWRAADVWDDNAPDRSGLYACSYLSPGGGRIVAFRGSELLGNSRYRNDYVSDLALAYQVPTPQQAQAAAYWGRLQGPFRGLSVTGHSLGGNLAVHAALFAPESVRRQISSCWSFNGPGVNPAYLKVAAKAMADLEGRVVLCQNKHDLVSSLLLGVTKPFIAASRVDPAAAEHPSVAGAVYPHSNFMFETDGDGVILPDPEGKKSGLCGLVEGLSALVLDLPAAAREELAAKILDILYDAPVPKDSARYVLEAVLGAVSRSELLSSPRGFGAAEVLYAANLLAGHTEEESLVRGLQQEPEPPEPRGKLASLAKTALFLVDVFRFLRKHV